MALEYVQNASKMCRKKTLVAGLFERFLMQIIEDKLVANTSKMRPNYLLSNNAIASAFAELAMSIYGFIAL